MILKPKKLDNYRSWLVDDISNEGYPCTAQIIQNILDTYDAYAEIVKELAGYNASVVDADLIKRARRLIK